MQLGDAPIIYGPIVKIIRGSSEDHQELEE
jgi:hypothetical protein